MKRMGEIKRLVRSFGYAFEGITYTIKTQRNMQIHVGMALVALFLTWSLNISWNHALLVFFSIFFVFILEMVNTAIEAVVDLVTRDFHPLAKVAKDVAAGAVLLGALFTVMVGLYVFSGPILRVLNG